MESPQPMSPPQPQQISPQPGIKDMLILVLFVSLVLSILGINIFAGVAYIIQYITNLLKPILSTLGFATGTVINTTADLTSDTAKFGIDVAEGTVQDIGNLFISASDKNVIPDFKQQYNKYSAALLNRAVPPTQTPSGAPTPAPVAVPVPVPVPVSVPTPAKTMDETINTPPPKYMNQVVSDTSVSNIQNAASKSNWCLIGDYKGRRSCIDIDDADRCLSGQVFPSQQICLNPTISAGGP